MLEPPACADISTCVKNASLLGPLLVRMAQKEHRDLPGIDQLKDELETLLKSNKQGMELDFLDLSKRAWALKKLCGFTKAKARRREVSTATGLRLYQHANLGKTSFIKAIFGVSLKVHIFWKEVGVRFGNSSNWCSYWILCSRQACHIRHHAYVFPKHRFAPAPYPYSLQAEVDAVNARVAERLKKRGRKDREGWTMVGGHWSSFLKKNCWQQVFVDINSIVNWFSFR